MWCCAVVVCSLALARSYTTVFAYATMVAEAAEIERILDDEPGCSLIAALSQRGVQGQ